MLRFIAGNPNVTFETSCVVLLTFVSAHLVFLVTMYLCWTERRHVAVVVLTTLTTSGDEDRAILTLCRDSQHYEKISQLFGEMFSAPKQNFPFPLIYSRSFLFVSFRVWVLWNFSNEGMTFPEQIDCSSLRFWFSAARFYTDFKSRCNISLPNRSRFVDLAVVSKKKTSII